MQLQSSPSLKQRVSLEVFLIVVTLCCSTTIDPRLKDTVRAVLLFLSISCLHWHRHVSSSISKNSFFNVNFFFFFFLQIVFKMYDVDGVGVVSWDDLFCIFKIVTFGNVSDVQLEHMCNCALDRFDATNDGELILKELTAMVPVDDLLMLSSHV